MAKDVYSGDDDQRRVKPAVVHLPLAFHVEADSAPDTLARILNILALSNLPLSSCHALAHSNDRMKITVEYDHLAPATAESLVRKLRQLTCVIEANISIHASETNVS